MSKILFCFVFVFNIKNEYNCTIITNYISIYLSLVADFEQFLWYLAFKQQFSLTKTIPS